MPSLCHPLSTLTAHSPVSVSLSRLRAYLPRLPVQHVIIEPVAALCRLLQLQYRAVVGLSHARLRRDATRRVSHSGALTLDGESIDLRDSIVEIRFALRADPIDRIISKLVAVPFLQLSPVVAKRKSAARSLNQ